jgi:hypothetical protein
MANKAKKNKGGRPRTPRHILDAIEAQLLNGVEPSTIIKRRKGKYRNQTYQVRDRLVREGKIAS